jgi:purine-cytosine permease-like protein
MATQVQPLGAPRDDLAAATLGIEPVPVRFQVLGFLDYTVLWADLGVGLLVLLAGTLLVPGLGFWTALAVIVVGTLVGNLLLGLAGMVGSDYGVPSMVTLRPSFGLRGSYLPSLVNAVQLVGWAAFEVIIMAHASERIAAPFLGAGSYPLWAVVWSAVVVLMALGGPLVVVRQWLEKAGIWIVLATIAWIVFYVVTHFDVTAAVARPGDGSLTFAQGVDLVVAMPVSWLAVVADYNRFARDSRSAFWGTFLGFGVANVGCYALGALLILVLPTSDPVGHVRSGRAAPPARRRDGQRLRRHLLDGHLNQEHPPDVVHAQAGRWRRSGDLGDRAHRGPGPVPDVPVSGRLALHAALRSPLCGLLPATSPPL